MMEIEIFRDNPPKIGLEEHPDFYIDSDLSPLTMSKGYERSTPVSESYCDSSPGSCVSISLPTNITVKVSLA